MPHTRAGCSLSSIGFFKLLLIPDNKEGDKEDNNNGELLLLLT